MCRLYLYPVTGLANLNGVLSVLVGKVSPFPSSTHGKNFEKVGHRAWSHTKEFVGADKKERGKVCHCSVVLVIFHFTTTKEKLFVVVQASRCRWGSFTLVCPLSAPCLSDENKIVCCLIMRRARDAFLSDEKKYKSCQDTRGSLKNAKVYSWSCVLRGVGLEETLNGKRRWGAYRGGWETLLCLQVLGVFRLPMSTQVTSKLPQGNA